MVYLTKFTKEELDNLKECQKRMTNMLQEFDRIISIPSSPNLIKK